MPDGILLYGRVDDAQTHGPVAVARVATVDSSAVALSDSLGNFVIRVPDEDGIRLVVDRLGYLSETFELQRQRESKRYVLLLEPSAIPIEGVTAEAQGAQTRLLTNLARRRNSYPSAMQAFDRSWLDRFGPTGGSVLDLVRQKMPGLFECRADAMQLCVRGRNPSFQNPYPEIPIRVCIDSWKAFGATNELGSLPVESVVLVELYEPPGAGDQVRVYTRQWLLGLARRNQTQVMPLMNGC